jgi:hypothetical protein
MSIYHWNFGHQLGFSCGVEISTESWNLKYYLAMSTDHARHVMPMGYNWRSSKAFVLGTISIALFAGLSPLLGFVYQTLIPNQKHFYMAS